MEPTAAHQPPAVQELLPDRMAQPEPADGLPAGWSLACRGVDALMETPAVLVLGRRDPLDGDPLDGDPLDGDPLDGGPPEPPEPEPRGPALPAPLPSPTTVRSLRAVRPREVDQTGLYRTSQHSGATDAGRRHVDHRYSA
ncbi:MAG: hypothetical protein ACRCXL_17060 [Dermatophilaceae bacterium]